ncbi:MAG: AMP-binding protein, partial [Acidimicrobiia bacterium]
MSTTLHEFTSPGGAEPPATENLTAALWRHEKDHPDHRILAYREGDSFRTITYSEMAHRVRRLAAGFIGLGLEPGTRVCLFMPTRPEFTLLDYAIWAAGCATVTIYETSSADQVTWIVTDSGAEVIVVGDGKQAAVFDEAMAGVADPPRLFVIDAGGLDELVEIGDGVGDDQVMTRARAVGHDDLATLVYTSGTTGMPKGCALTVRNFVATVQAAVSTLPEVLNMEATTLMFLPLAHSFARIVEVGSVASGARIAYSTGIPQLMEELAMVKPTWLFSVPRVFEKVYNSASQKAHGEGKGKIFDFAARVAGDYSRQKGAG